jgi:hypothetical protein
LAVSALAVHLEMQTLVVAVVRVDQVALEQHLLALHHKQVEMVAQEKVHQLLERQLFMLAVAVVVSMVQPKLLTELSLQHQVTLVLVDQAAVEVLEIKRMLQVIH